MTSSTSLGHAERRAVASMATITDDCIACYCCLKAVRVAGSAGLQEARKHGWREAAGNSVWVCPVCSLNVFPADEKQPQTTGPTRWSNW